MNYRAVFNNVKQAKAFCREHFNGLDLQAVYHPQEHHCATATWGGRAKDAHVHISKALPGLFRAQSQMHAQQGWEMLLSQGKVLKPPRQLWHIKAPIRKWGQPKKKWTTQGR